MPGVTSQATSVPVTGSVGTSAPLTTYAVPSTSQPSTSGVVSAPPSTSAAFCVSPASVHLSVNASMSRVQVVGDRATVYVSLSGLPSAGVCGNVLPSVLVYVRRSDSGAGGWRLIGSFETCGGVDSLDVLRLPSDEAALGALQFRLDVDAFGEFASGLVSVSVYGTSAPIEVPVWSSSSGSTTMPGVTSQATSVPVTGSVGTSVPSTTYAAPSTSRPSTSGVATASPISSAPPSSSAASCVSPLSVHLRVNASMSQVQVVGDRATVYVAMSGLPSLACQRGVPRFATRRDTRAVHRAV